MRAIRLFTVPVAASLLLGAVAHASEAAGVREGRAGKSEVVKGTGLPWNVETSQQVSPAKVQHYPEPHWTAAIGTGTAAALQTSVEGFQPVSAVKAQHYPEPDWASTIGTGTAAAVKR